jgi:hypothetical protein
MSFQETQQRVESARADLAHAQDDAAGWADEQRRKFDANRMKPLADAGVRFTTALQRAREQAEAAERLMRD